jgi:hypothetical protein
MRLRRSGRQKPRGGSFSFVPMDLAEEGQIIAAVRAVLSHHSRLDCTVNRAGVDPSGGCSIVNIGSIAGHRALRGNSLASIMQARLRRKC